MLVFTTLGGLLPVQKLPGEGPKLCWCFFATRPTKQWGFRDSIRRSRVRGPSGLEIPPLEVSLTIKHCWFRLAQLRFYPDDLVPPTSAYQPEVFQPLLPTPLHRIHDLDEIYVFDPFDILFGHLVYRASLRTASAPTTRGAPFLRASSLGMSFPSVFLAIWRFQTSALRVK